jgi:hypothetical protein
VYQVISAEYAQNMLVMLPQDLHTFLVYWDFTDLRNQVVRDFLERINPECLLQLRLCRFDPARQFLVAEQTVPLTQITSGNYYFKDLSSVATYYCEIGAQKPDGNFICFNQTDRFCLQPSAAFLASEEWDGGAVNEVQGPQLIALKQAEDERRLIAESSWR